MPIFDLIAHRLDHEENPRLVEVLRKTVEWKTLPREGDVVAIADILTECTVEAVEIDDLGYLIVDVGNVVCDDAEVTVLRTAGWQAGSSVPWTSPSAEADS